MSNKLYLVLVTNTQTGKRYVHGKNNPCYLNPSPIYNGEVPEWVLEGAYRSEAACRKLADKISKLAMPCETVDICEPY